MIRHGFVTRDSRVASHDLSQCPDPTRPDPLLVTAVSGVSGTTSIDLTVGVESPPEAWMLEDIDLSFGHIGCTGCRPTIRPLDSYIALCGRRALAAAGDVYSPPAGVCAECAALFYEPCPRCGK